MMENSGKDSSSLSQPIPEIRIRKGSDVPSISESEAEQEGYAPLAFDEGLSDLDENLGDAEKDHGEDFTEDVRQVSGVISPTLQLNLSSPDEPSPVWDDGGSDKENDGDAEKVQDRPRPPRPATTPTKQATTPTKPPPPRPPQMKSPDHTGVKKPPARPSVPLKSPLNTPSDSIQEQSFNQGNRIEDDDFGTTPCDVDYSAQDLYTKPLERPHGTTPIGFTSLTDYRDTDSPTPSNTDQEKIKITLPKSAKAKSAKKQQGQLNQDGQNEVEKVLTPPPGKRHAPAPPPPPSIVKTRPTRPPLPPPPSKAALGIVVAEPIMKWEVFDDGPSHEEKTPEDEVSEAAATSNDDGGDDPFSVKPADGGNSTGHATNSFDDESKLCDPSSPTEKKSHKYKGIGTKRLRGFLDPKKAKNTTKKEKKNRVREKELFSKFLTDECKDVNEKSPEFLAFQQMQDRIKQTVESSQENLSKHKMEFEDELHKLAISADNSPWFIVPPDGVAVVEEDTTNSEKPDPKALWDCFDDDFDTVPNPDITKHAQQLNASSTPSPNPLPPYNSRCASSEQLSEMATANGEADLLGLNQGEVDEEQTDGLGSSLLGLGRVSGSETLNVDILGLSRNPMESNKSSGRSSPSAFEADMAALGIIAENTDDASEIGGSLVDDFLGITLCVKSADNTTKSVGDVLDILGFDDKTASHDNQPTLTSNHGNLLGGTTPTEPQGSQLTGMALLGSSADAKASAFTASISNDDIFGLGAKKETDITSVKSGENLFSFGEEAFDNKNSKHPDVGVATSAAPTLLNDEFDPRADFDNLDAKPITDDSADMWGAATVKPQNPFTSGAAGEQAATISSSANPFTTKNPFLSSDANAVEDIPFADGESSVNVFEDKTLEPSTGIGGFNPFATITDDSAAVDESSFDPFQTIHDDDAFEVHFPDETEAEKKEDGSKSPSRFNPFDKEPPLEEKFANFKPSVAEEASHSTTEYSTEEEDENAEPFQPFHAKFDEAGWKMLQRLPTKKKLTQNRYWKEVYVKLVMLNDVPLIKVYKNQDCKECVHELGLQYSYTLCNLGLQQFDQYGKCHTVKIQYVFYRERIGVKGERIAPTFSDLTRVRDFKSLRDLVHKPKATMILDHVPQASELIKFGGLSYKDFCSFIWQIEDALFHLPAPREKPLTYTKDEITVDIIDEFVLHLDKDGHIGFNKARVRIFCLAFLTGDKPTVEIGINDKWRQGKEVVRRQDIIPIKTDEWIRIYEPEFHLCVHMDEYEKTHVIQLLPPDACHFEVMRFRVRPRLNKELPLQIRCSMSVVDRHVEMRAEILIPGYYSNSRKSAQTPCEDIQVRFPIPEPWIYMFRVEKRFRYGSVKSATRKSGKIKGLERLTMMAQGILPSSLIEVSSGIAKYEHVYHNIIWRINRLPERNEGAYKTHIFTMKLDLGPHDTVPDTYDKDVFVEYAMPNSTVSRAQVRSISIDTDTSPDKWVHHVAKYEYKVEMEFTDKPFTEMPEEKDMMFPVTLEGKEMKKEKPSKPTTEDIVARRASLAEKEDEDSDSSSSDSD